MDEPKVSFYMNPKEQHRAANRFHIYFGTIENNFLYKIYIALEHDPPSMALAIETYMDSYTLDRFINENL